MKVFSRHIIALTQIALVCATVVVCAANGAEALDGRWEASVTIKETVIPFRLDITAKGGKLIGTLYNGDQKQTTTDAKFEEGKIVLNFEHYLTKIVATLKNGNLEGSLEGRFEREKYLSNFPFEAKRYTAPSAAAVANVPSIDGLWEVPYESGKGEKAWRLIIKQNGAELGASILRIDGDTGLLTGSWQGDKFVVSHFDGSRPLRLEITPTKEGTLQLSQNGAYAAKGALVAYRPEVARAKGLPQPANFNTHTTVRDPNEVFKFSFPDLNGKLVSNTDARYKNKVVIAVVTGTWCPNCHDEAQYLVQLDKKYRDKGLEIVALNFEEPEQQDDLARAKAFVKKYGVQYPYLIAGAPVEMWEKVPQGVNLNTWPATFFIGRDGLVKKIHAGFAAPASGVYHEQLKADFTATIEALLNENVASNAPSTTRSTQR